MNINEHIDSYLSGQLSDEEVQTLLAWVKESDEHRKEFSDACRLWNTLHSTQYNNEKAYAQFVQKTTDKKSRIIPLWAKISAVAATVLIIVCCFSIFKFQQTAIITVNNSDIAVKTVVLPDNSIVYLQQNSSISYPESFKNDSRSITTTGNVFCEIFHNEDAPFTLTTDNIAVKVLGTSFQVNTLDSTSVVVETGKVQVSTDNQAVVITKGERADLVNGIITTSNNTDLNFLSWKTGKLQFKNKNLTQVLSDIARHYHYQLAYEYDTQSIFYTGSFDNSSLDEVLQTIELSIPEVNFATNGNVICIRQANK